MNCEHLSTTRLGNNVVCMGCLRIILEEYVEAPNNEETRQAISGTTSAYLAEKVAEREADI